MVKALELDIEDAFLFKVAGRVVDVMRDAYPDLAENQEKIALIIRADEERFEKTLARGMAILRDAVDDLKRGTRRTLPGDVVFKLYDTYGFPVEITQELADAGGFGIDLDGFEHAMEDQRERARQASKIGKEAEAAEDITEAHEGFVGYENLEIPTVVVSLRGTGGDGPAEPGEVVEVVLERTPFYPEGGGQVGDVGTIAGTGGIGRVTDVKVQGGRIIHMVKVEKGTLAVGDGVVARVDAARRKAIQRNHTATHLMHGALRSVLGGHVRQSGSLVSSERLRFDFTHYEPLSDEDIRTVEDMVNTKVLADLPVKTAVEAFEDAKARGAIALFGDKYGRQVRVVEIENTSCELCGGTHVRATGEIGSFRITSESGIAAGIRRIEAITGHAVLDTMRRTDRDLSDISAVLRVPARDVVEGARKLVERMKNLEKDVSRLQSDLAGGEVERIVEGAEEVVGIRVAAARVEAASIEILKELADKVKERLGEGVVCVGTVAGDRAIIVASVDDSIAEKRGIKASAIAKKMGEYVGGKGGGKSTFAQAGGKDTGNLAEAIAKCSEVVDGLAGKQA